MQIVFMDLGIPECNELYMNKLSIQHGTAWSAEPMYSIDFTYGCDGGDFSLYKNKSDMINHLVAEREKFEELFPEHYEDYLNIIEYLKMFKH